MSPAAHLFHLIGVFAVDVVTAHLDKPIGSFSEDFFDIDEVISADATMSNKPMLFFPHLVAASGFRYFVGVGHFQIGKCLSELSAKHMV